MIPLPDEQIAEWFDNPVTMYFFELMKQRLDAVYELRASVFYTGEPFKTQEAKAMFLGMEAAFNEVVDALDTRNLGELQEEIASDEERIRYSPRPRQGVN